jgi:hypothetical protein
VVLAVRRATDREALRVLQAGALDPRREALVRADRGGATTVAPPVRVAAPGWRAATVQPGAPDEVRVRVPAGPRGRLVLAAAYSPQWEAELDGRPAPMQATDFAAMGIDVPAGSHLVTFRLERGSLALAAALSGLALLAVVALWLDVPRRLLRRGRPRRPGR